MGTEAGIEGIEKGVLHKSWASRSGSCLSSTVQIPDPVVYKLVRVEVDGRLVPATDEEVMEVEELLMDTKNEMHILSDTGHDAECIYDRECSSRIILSKDSEGLSQSKDGRGQPDKLNSQLKETDPSLVQSLSSDQNKGCNVGEYAYHSDKPVEGDSSRSATIAASKPGFSNLKGEICLDNLSIRELQETFIATFGRETNVKDKLWLKRRITMGLTNSCDVSPTSFIIKDHKLVKKDSEEACNNMSVSSVAVAATTTDLRSKLSPIHIGQQQNVSDKKHNSINEMCESEDSHTGQRAAKRARKPTRRYIEELSEVESRESNARFPAPNDYSTMGYACKNSVFRHVGSISSDGRPMITRLDSLGGSRIQVPYACRIRRSRPRTNYTAFLTVNPSRGERAASLVEDPLYDFQSSNESLDNTFRAISAPKLVVDQVASHAAEDKQLVVSQTGCLGPQPELQHVNSSVTPSDHVVAPKSSGCVRRKHHRAWTLCEVVKLVDGVSRFGAGRWSEIKKVAFASYSYRTSVDLKDKWRNLLKASFAQGPSNKEISSRKNSGATPLPAPILFRVRELAELHAQVAPTCSSNKLDTSIGSNTLERHPVSL